MKAIIFYGILIIMTLAMVKYFAPLNFSYELSNVKSIQYNLEKQLESIND